MCSARAERAGGEPEATLGSGVRRWAKAAVSVESGALNGERFETTKERRPDGEVSAARLGDGAGGVMAMGVRGRVSSGDAEPSLWVELESDDESEIEDRSGGGGEGCGAGAAGGFGSAAPLRRRADDVECACDEAETERDFERVVREICDERNRLTRSSRGKCL